MRLVAAARRMAGDPVAGDRQPRREPYLVVGERIVEEPSQRRRAAGTPDEARVQADRHHLGRAEPLRVERVEAVFEIGEELVAGIEALRRGEAHVIGVERIGHDELRPFCALDPIGQFVGVGVRQIEEAAVLAGQVQRVDGAAALVEAERARAGQPLMQRDGLGDRVALGVAREILVVDPFQAMRGDFPAGVLHRGDRIGVARHGGRDGEDGDGNCARREQPVQPPKTGARAIFVDRLHVHVALPRPRLRADDLREEGFRRRVAMQDVVLAAFLVIDDELQRDARPARPIGVRRMGAVADHVARIALAHRLVLKSRGRWNSSTASKAAARGNGLRPWRSAPARHRGRAASPDP